MPPRSTRSRPCRHQCGQAPRRRATGEEDALYHQRKTHRWGDALSTHVKTELGATIEKYSQRPTDATVTFSKDAHQFTCDAVVHLSTGLNVAARGTDTDIYAAFEACRERMDKQLRRYKRRLKDHHKDRTQPVVFGEAGSYVLAADEDAWESQDDSLQPIIIAEMQSRVPTLSVGDAVMQMELSGTLCWCSATKSTGASMSSTAATTATSVGSIRAETADRTSASRRRGTTAALDAAPLTAMSGGRTAWERQRRHATC